MEIRHSLNQRYLDFIKKQRPLEQESWILKESRVIVACAPFSFRVEERVSPTYGLKEHFYTKKRQDGQKVLFLLGSNF